MADEDPARSRTARTAAELALVRVADFYGGRPEFVLLGGLVPAILCAASGTRHAGTTDVDVQVDLEISAGSVNAARLEHALRRADFHPDGTSIWRWKSSGGPQGATVKFELLADLDTHPAGATIGFKHCDELGAVNLRGTGFAARDREVRVIATDDQDVRREAEIYVTGFASSSWPRRRPPTAAARKRTGTTSPTSCSTTTTEIPWPPPAGHGTYSARRSRQQSRR